MNNTKIIQEALKVLKTHGPMRGSDLGWALWGKNHRTMCGEGGNNKFCRPAGKLLKRMQALGLVYERPELHRTFWRLSLKGFQEAG